MDKNVVGKKNSRAGQAAQTYTLQTRRQVTSIPRLVDFKRASDRAKTRFGLPPMHDSRKDRAWKRGIKSVVHFIRGFKF